METKLTDDNLTSFFDKYDELKYCVLWKDVGRDLRLKQGEINVIAEDYKDKGTQRCSYEMFLRWISKSENPTLERLLQVITAVKGRHERMKKREKILEEGKRAERSVKRLERVVSDWEERNQKLDSDLKSRRADLNKEKSWFLSAQRNESLPRESAERRKNLIQAIRKPGNNSQFIKEFLQSQGYPTSYIFKNNVVEGILRHALLEIDIKRSVKMIRHFRELKEHNEKVQHLRTETRDFKHLLEKRLRVYEKVQRGLREIGVSPANLQKLHDQSKSVEVIVEECKSTVLECDKMCQKAQKDLSCWKEKENVDNFTKSFNDNIEVMLQNEIKYNQELLSLFENFFVIVGIFLFGREWELRRTRARAQERHVDPQVARQIQDYQVTLEEGIQRMEQLRSIT